MAGRQKQPTIPRKPNLRTIGILAAGVLVCICAALGSRVGGKPPATAQPAQLVAEPTAVPATEAPAATVAPTRTRIPIPTIVAPTMDPAFLITPVITGEGRDQAVDPPYWPCKEGQVKGNRNSDIYHVPGGASYARTFKDVQCFNTPADAEVAGFTAAQN